MQSSIPRITREQYNLWRNSPVTLTVFEFLKAYRDQMRIEHCDRWEQGELDEQLESRAIGVIIFTTSFLQLEFDALEQFLSSKEDNGDNETKLTRPILSKDYYVYILYDIDEVTPIYVGKGKNGRWLQHERIALTGKCTYINPRLYKRILKILNKIGYLYKIKVLENAFEDEALKVEISLIAQFGRADQNLGPLLNLADGGEGISGASAETRRKMSLSRMGRPSTWTPESKAKAILSRTGKKRGPHSAKHKENISKALIGKKRKPHSKERIEKQRASIIETLRSKPYVYRPQSKASIEKRRLALIGKKRTLDQRMNISKGLTGIVFAEQRRKNMSEAAKRYRASLRK